jgi:hypothetical protein
MILKGRSVFFKYQGKSGYKNNYTYVEICLINAQFVIIKNEHFRWS